MIAEDRDVQNLDLKSHDWLGRADVVKLFEAFESSDLSSERVRFVGGCVRNALLGVPIDDIDLATSLKPEAVQDLLRQANIQSVPTGLSYGTLTAIVDGTPFEITSLRKDIATDGRRAVVDFTEDWVEDAQRRDFTINALYADRDGRIYDPTGQGLDDLKSRRLRFIGCAKARINEDYLRILRYFRFVAFYSGEARLDKAAVEACRTEQAGLKKISAERVWKEIKKLLSASDPARALRVMLTGGILQTLLPEAHHVEGIERLIALERDQNLAPDPLLRLMAMSAREPLAMALLCKRLKLSKVETRRLRGWADSELPLSPLDKDREHYAAIYNIGRSVAVDRAILRAAGEDDPERQGKWLALSAKAQDWTVPTFPLSGEDLEAEGVLPGPEMGRILKALQALWIRSEFKAEPSQLMMALALLQRKN